MGWTGRSLGVTSGLPAPFLWVLPHTLHPHVFALCLLTHLCGPFPAFLPWELSGLPSDLCNYLLERQRPRELPRTGSLHNCLRRLGLGLGHGQSQEPIQVPHLGSGTQFLKPSLPPPRDCGSRRQTLTQRSEMGSSTLTTRCPPVCCSLVVVS